MCILQVVLSPALALELLVCDFKQLRVASLLTSLVENHHILLSLTNETIVLLVLVI